MNANRIATATAYPMNVTWLAPHQAVRSALLLDVNCDNIVNTLDITIISSSANFGKSACDANNMRADVFADGIISTLDIAVAASSGCFGQ